jgi:hypothetical protein
VAGLPADQADEILSDAARNGLSLRSFRLSDTGHAQTSLCGAAMRPVRLKFPARHLTGLTAGQGDLGAPERRLAAVCADPE